MVNVVAFSSNDILELSSNTYIVTDSFSSCIVIDPSRNDNKVIDYIESHHLNLKGVLLTHAHFDHVRGLDQLIDHFHVPFYLEENDSELLTNPIYNCSASYHRGGSLIVRNKPTLVKDFETLKLLSEDILVISTPFHTSGSACYYLSNSNILFSGDSLFYLAVGRSDLPTSVNSEIKRSLSKIMSLEDEVEVYPGHGKSTTIGYERKYNPFIKH